MDAPLALSITPYSDEKVIEDSREFHNLLNDYYLKVELNTYGKLKLISYNKKLLDNIRYEKQLSINTLYQLCSAFKAYDIKQIYEIIIKKIEDGKFDLTKKDGDLFFNMKITDPLGNLLEVPFKLKDVNSNKKDEFLDMLSKEIILLRKQKEELEEIKSEQNDFKKEIEELKKLV